MTGHLASRIAIALLFLSAVAMAAAPDHAPAALAPALISVAWPWWEGWRAARGTALRPALVWAGLAILAAVAAQAVGWGEPIATGRPGAGRLTYLSSLSALAALVSVLNARAPGGRVWAALMAILVVVFLIPWLEGPWRVRKAGGLTALHLDAPWTIFYGLLVVVGVTNYLPTRFGVASGWLAAGFALEFFGLTREDWPASGRAALWAWSSWAMAVAGWSAYRRGGASTSARSDLERLWFWFRDLWGVVWALRVQERFNRTAESKGWPVRLGWFGLEPARSSSGTADASSEQAEAPAEAVATFRGLIRRFARPERVAEVLGTATDPDPARLAIRPARHDHNQEGAPLS